MPLTTRRVPLRIVLQNLGFPKRETWQAPSYLKPTPFKFDPSHEWPEAVQRAFWEYSSETTAGKLEFNHQYEKAWRLANRRFSWRGKDWKNPIVKLGEQMAARETFNREAFDAYNLMRPKQTFHEFKKPLSAIVPTTNPMEMKLEIKDRLDFGGVANGRVVA